MICPKSLIEKLVPVLSGVGEEFQLIRYTPIISFPYLQPPWCQANHCPSLYRAMLKLWWALVVFTPLSPWQSWWHMWHLIVWQWSSPVSPQTLISASIGRFLNSIRGCSIIDTGFTNAEFCKVNGIRAWEWYRILIIDKHEEAGRPSG